MAKFGIGNSVRRVEDPRLLTGGGRYTDDTRLAAPAVRLYVLRSPHAHADISRIDTAAAKKAPGVLLVLTGDDVTKAGFGDVPCLVPLQNRDGSERADTSRPMLAKGRVRHVGDPVALVVAETLEQAKDAAELIEVDYAGPAARRRHLRGGPARRAARARPHQEQHRVRLGDGRPGRDRGRLRQGRPRGHPAAGQPAAGGELDGAARRDLRLRRQRRPLDPVGVLAGRHMIRPVVADMILKIGSPKLRVRTGDVGGGFGMKIFVHPEYPMVVWASRTLKRTVKWIPDRQEAFQSDVQGRDHVSIAEMALDKDCRFLGDRITTYAALGAYLSHFSAFIPTLAGSSMLNGLYTTPAVYVNVKGVMTNTVPTDAYRGAGRPEAAYLMERFVDHIARETGLTPDEIRASNFIKPAQLPYKTALGDTYDSGDFEDRDAQGHGQGRLEGLRRRGARNRPPRASGAASAWRPMSRNARAARPRRRSPCSTTTTRSRSTSATSPTARATRRRSRRSPRRRLGIDIDRIRIVQGDSDVTPDGFTGGSRRSRWRARRRWASPTRSSPRASRWRRALLEASAADIDYGDGAFKIVGTDRSVSLFDVRRKDPRQCRRARPASTTSSRARRRPTPTPTAVTSASSRSIPTPARSRSLTTA